MCEKKSLPSRVTLPEKNGSLFTTTSTLSEPPRSEKFQSSQPATLFDLHHLEWHFQWEGDWYSPFRPAKTGACQRKRGNGTPKKKIGILFGWWTSEASWFLLGGIWRVLGLKWYRLIKQEIQKIPKRTPIVKPSSFGHELEGWTQKIRSPEVSKGDWLENNEIRKIKNSRYVSYRCIYIYIYDLKNYLWAVTSCLWRSSAWYSPRNLG